MLTANLLSPLPDHTCFHASTLSFTFEFLNALHSSSEELLSDPTFMSILLLAHSATM